MGGGTRRIQEVRRARLLSPRDGGLGLGSRGSGAGTPEDLSICEREQSLIVQIADGESVEIGQSIAVVRGMPLAVIADDRRIGYIADRRQSAVMLGCLNAGFRIAGEVTAFDVTSRAALATVAGARSAA